MDVHVSDDTENGKPGRILEHLIAREESTRCTRCHELECICGASARGIARDQRDAVDAYVGKVLLSKPCSPVTRRAIELITKYANTEVARLQRELNDAIANVQSEHRAALEQIAQDAAVTEGVDLSVYQLQAPGDVSPYWKPR